MNTNLTKDTFVWASDGMLEGLAGRVVGPSETMKGRVVVKITYIPDTGIKYDAWSNPEGLKSVVMGGEITIPAKNLSTNMADWHEIYIVDDSQPWKDHGDAAMRRQNNSLESTLNQWARA